jgi:ubiquinol-cytochrome c reductase subunit 8
MGHKEFGNLIKSKNIVSYTLSPFEQRAFAGVSAGIGNWVRRMRTNLMYMAPGFISLVLIYNYAKASNQLTKRKNPKDYENEE